MDISNIQQRLNDNPCLVGLAVVISNDYTTRSSGLYYPILTGTIKDGDAMAQSLEKLKYLVVRKHNATLAFMLALLQKIAEGVNFPPSYKRIVFIFAGHGKDGGTLVTCEGNAINVSSIIDKLSPSAKNQSVTQLGSMARMFFIDACRGSKDDLGFKVIPRGTGTTSDRGGQPVEKIRISEQPSNIIVAFPTVSGYKSYEVAGEGGIWLQCLARKLLECNCSIGDVLVEVNKELSELWKDPRMQKIMNPETINRLFDKVNFFEEAKSYKSVVLASSTQVNCLQSPGVCVPPPVCDRRLQPWCTNNGSVRQKVSLAASFNQQQQPMRHHVQAQITTNNCGSNGLLLSQPKKINLAAIPPVTPPSLQMNHQDSLLSRNSPGQQLGEFRGCLNRYRMKGVITEYHFKTSENIKEQGSFKSTVTCLLTSGEEVAGDSVNYYTGKKGISEEMAAKNALAKIEQLIKTSSLSDHHTVTMTSTNPLSVSNVAIPKSVSIGANGSDNSTSPTSTAKVYKQFLHNLLVQQLRREIPKYDTKRDEQGHFQCTISHQLFGFIAGSKFPNKKDAENSAAWRAWSKLKNYH